MHLEIVAGNTHRCREKMTKFAVPVRSNGTGSIPSANHGRAESTRSEQVKQEESHGVQTANHH